MYQQQVRSGFQEPPSRAYPLPGSPGEDVHKGATMLGAMSVLGLGVLGYLWVKQRRRRKSRQLGVAAS